LFRRDVSKSRSRKLRKIAVRLSPGTRPGDKVDGCPATAPLPARKLPQIIPHGFQILDPPAPSGLGRLEDNLLDRRMDISAKMEQILTILHEPGQHLTIGEILTQSQAGQDHSNRENIGERIVMPAPDVPN